MERVNLVFYPGQKVRRKSGGHIMTLERYEKRPLGNSSVIHKVTFDRKLSSQSQKLEQYTGWVECKWVDKDAMQQSAFFKEHELEPITLTTLES